MWSARRPRVELGGAAARLRSATAYHTGHEALPALGPAVDAARGE